MPRYEQLLQECPVPVNDQADLPNGYKGFYYAYKADKAILLDKQKIKFRREKVCVLAEEIGHHYTTVGDITDQTKLTNRKQERRARVWAYKKLVTPEEIVKAHKAAIWNRHELAEYLQVTEEFLEAALNWYKEKYGLYVKVDNWTVCFEPLGVLELFE